MEDSIDQLIQQHQSHLKKIVKVRFQWYTADGYIWRSNIMTKLTIKVKVFHGERKTHTLTVSIHDKL